MKNSKKSSTSNQEHQEAKSPAEFFAENQAIAGFDNMGKSLYTTIRELVENALDACESVNVLPEISITIEDMDMSEFNKVRGMASPGKNSVDTGLFEKAGKKRTSIGKASSRKDEKGMAQTKDGSNVKTPKTPLKKRKSNDESYLRISVKDNGCGMVHEAIPNLLGKVLSGSKYGVRQTRGKFGLGAKMALIWSKKSTGVPIKIKTAHMQSKASNAKHISKCILDIDIYKNEPKVIEHEKIPNDEGWVGTEMEVLIAGNWTTYKARIVRYLQQLAIITPYARLKLDYSKMGDVTKDMVIRYDRRSEQMPPPAREVKHHPSSINNLLCQQLVDKSKSTTFLKFLCNDLSGVTPSIAKRVIAELGGKFSESLTPSNMTGKQITTLVQLLRKVELFRAPDGSCLSPLGEYNLNLGIRKVIEPDIVATSRDKPSSYEGHPFIVEAAISLGGSAKEGINVFRFSNRIPLLFEAGADVVTRVAQNKIKWSSYKIDHKRDKINVFVSIVSTKIPFKGTGKEYIGDDIIPIQQSVKRALQSCCQQLKSHLSKRNALRDIKERKSRLIKYVPDVSRSIFGILDSMRKRKAEDKGGDDPLSSPRSAKARRIARPQPLLENATNEVLKKLDSEIITVDSFKADLMETIENVGVTAEGALGVDSGSKKKGLNKDETSRALYLVPCYNSKEDTERDIVSPVLTFRPMIKSSST